MSKVIFDRPVACMMGKVCGDSRLYYRTNPVTGRTHTGVLQHPYKGAPSAAQSHCREHFRQVMALVSQRLRDPEIKARVRQEFLAQNEVGTLVAFAYRKWKNEVI